MSRDGSAVPRGQRTLVLMPAEVTPDDVFCRVSRIFLGRNGRIAGQQFRSGIPSRDDNPTRSVAAMTRVRLWLFHEPRKFQSLDARTEQLHSEPPVPSVLPTIGMLSPESVAR